MALPIVKTPTYEEVLPSTGKKFQFRPFVAKEEKILLMAKESGKEEDMIASMRDVISACTFEKIDAKELPTFDLEFIFLQLRARSIGDIAKIKFECVREVPVMVENDDPTQPDVESNQTKTCGGDINVDVNLLDVKVVFPEGHTNIIVIDEEEGIGVKFKYPSVAVYEQVKNFEKADSEKQMVALCDNIFDKNNVYPAQDTKPGELEEFFANLMRPVYEDIEKNFFKSMPRVEHTIKYKCPKCGYEGEYTFTGIKDFF